MRVALKERLRYYPHVVATIALFVALGGPGYAAGIINGKTLKKRSVAGKKLKRNTVTGVEVNESKLGKVPLAAQADSAANADNLDGKDSSAFAAAGAKVANATHADSADDAG